MLSGDNIQTRFEEIYRNNFWSSDESLSGEGSEVEYTSSIRRWLIENLPKLNIKVFVDAPCGDFNWMKLVLPKLDLNYTGLDIVPSLINKNNEDHGSDNIKFEISNICEDDLPACDLIMIRDCLFHLSFEDIDKVLNNLKSSDYKYLLTTTHLVDDVFENEDITSGDFRLIDLFKSPFNFNRANIISHIVDYPTGYPLKREMILIKKEHVPNRLIYKES